MTQTLRIIDAALNRAGEGLRVVEDFVRFVLDDYYLMGQVKTLRHDLAQAVGLLPTVELHAARETLSDVGSTVSTEAERRRGDAWDVCAASLKRAQQSLRSLEEYGKLLDADFSGQCESLRYRLYTLEKAIGIGQASRERLDGVRLCVLVDGCASTAKFDELVQSLVGAGAGMIQLRAKRLDDRELIGRARRLRELTRGTPTVAIINDRADIAAAVNADGVHVGQDDLSVKDARATLGPRALVGVSTHNIEQVRAAVLDGADYLGAGPTFPSRTKSFDGFAGTSFLREVAAETGLPTFAIGGIGADNLLSVLETGISRVAVEAAVTQAVDPALATRRLLGMLNRPVTRHGESRATEATSPNLIPEP